MVRIVSLFVLVALAAPARAQSPTETTEADRLFEEGRAFAKDKRWVEACERFERSFAIDPSIGTTLNLADCHEHLGHLRQAWQLFEAAATKSQQTDDDKRTRFARQRAAAAERRLATVVVRLPQPLPAGIAISVGNRDVAASAEIRERVDPGNVEVTATVPDHPRFATSVAATEGATVEVVVPAFTTEVRPEEPTGRRGRVRLAWGLAGGGAASAIVATILTLKARNDYNATVDSSNCHQVTGGFTCNEVGDRAIADSQRLANIGTGFAIGSALLVGAAAAVYLTAPRSSVHVAPVATERSLGVSVVRAF